MSISPMHPNAPPDRARDAEAWVLALALRALARKPGAIALAAPPDRARAALAALAVRLEPEIRAVVVRGGALETEALCEQVLRALRADASVEPRVVLEAYLSHLRSCSARLALLVEAADALPTATQEWLARQLRGPASSLRLVAAGEDPDALLRLVDRCGARDSLVRLGDAANESEPSGHDGAARTRAEGPRPEPGSMVPGPAAQRRARIAWTIRAAALAAVVTAGLLWSRTGDETRSQPATSETRADRAASVSEPVPGAAVGTAARGEPAVVGSADPDRLVTGPHPELPPDERGAPDPAPVSAARDEIPPLEVALDALESGDAVTYKRAIRRVDGAAAAQAEAVLLRHLEEPRREDAAHERSRRMLAAWGLAVVGDRGALPALEVAANDPDPHVAALAARSAALIRAHLAEDEPGAPRR